MPCRHNIRKITGNVYRCDILKCHVFISLLNSEHLYFYCCTVHFDDSVTFIRQILHLYIYIYIYIYICYQSLKHFVYLIAPTRFDIQRVIIRELYFPG
jgi:hypothetical protein